MDNGQLVILPISIVYQLYKDNGRLIMKGCVQRNPVLRLKIFSLPRI